MKKELSLPLLLIAMILQVGCSQSPKNINSNKSQTNQKEITTKMEGLEIATFGAGCFWCVEACFQDLKGVEKVVSGYAGGQVVNPTYKEVCTGTTGHAEVIQVTFDPKVVSYEVLLEAFWSVHDPTTLNRQGNDIGTQYRSVIFYHNEEQKQQAEASKKAAATQWADPIVTEISAISNYSEAENYHQDYFNQNGDKNPYCSSVVAPKVVKFRKKYADLLK